MWYYDSEDVDHLFMECRVSKGLSDRLISQIRGNFSIEAAPNPSVIRYASSNNHIGKMSSDLMHEQPSSIRFGWKETTEFSRNQKNVVNIWEDINMLIGLRSNRQTLVKIMILVLSRYRALLD